MRNQESGFTLVELMIASVITTVIMGVAFSTFKDALALNESVVNLADASQNLRAGTNLLVRDLLQAGRGIDTGGIPIPSGPTANAVLRPMPPGTTRAFDNDTAGTTLSGITTGEALGPTISGRKTDLVTILLQDPFHSELKVYAPNSPTSLARLEATGASLDTGTTGWEDGLPVDGIPAIAAGDLIYFSGVSSGSAMQTVTRVDGTTIHFEATDPFRLNQRGATIPGSITQIIPAAAAMPTCAVVANCNEIVTVKRLFMYTYYVHADAAGVPRLMRAVNHAPPQALAGVIEDLEVSYDLVDGTNNPTNVKQLPFTTSGLTYLANQIRKVNVHVGVRSEARSARTNDYLRNHVSTVVSLRNMAYVDRYDSQ
jgi:prepilin-type N-terminal cleavage/methylation domain-containing protein